MLPRTLTSALPALLLIGLSSLVPLGIPQYLVHVYTSSARIVSICVLTVSYVAINLFAPVVCGRNFISAGFVLVSLLPLDLPLPLPQPPWPRPL